MKWTVESFIELLKRHGTLGPYVKADKPYHACIDGWVDLEALVSELNEQAIPAIVKWAMTPDDSQRGPA